MPHPASPPRPLVFETTTETAFLDQVDAGLDAHNRQESALAQVQPLAVAAQTPTGQTVGGVVGRTWGQCAEIQQLWVAPTHRRQGTGRQLLENFHTLAAQRGCTRVYLETFSFQAPDFYRANGYQFSHVIEGFPAGIQKFLMEIRLNTTPSRP